MSENTAALLEAFEKLAPSEKLDFANAILRRLPLVDSGALDDEDVAAAGDIIAAMLDKEEDDANTR
ncbi:MAG: hypothetical protein FJ403_08355 [Verrucomicrobia bacterium]|nr:hypothetical protein [Verrucomicrobiota bacterium]